MKKVFIASFITILSSGCETVNHNKYITESHIQKKKIELNESGYYPSYNSIVSLCKTAETANKVCNVPSELLSEFLKEGLLLTKANCMTTLEDINQGSKNSRWLKDEFLIGTVLATGLMSLNGASSNSIEKLALWSSFLVSSSELYNNYYLLGPDSKSVINLVERALQKQEEYALSSRPASFTAAAKEVLNYSIVCSSSKIDELVQQSMEKADIKVPEKESYLQDLGENLRKVLGAPKLNSEQISAIYYLVEMQNDKYQPRNFDRKINSLLGDYENEINNNAQKLLSILSNYPLDVQDALKNNALYWKEVQLRYSINNELDNFNKFVDSNIPDDDKKQSLIDVFTNNVFDEKSTEKLTELLDKTILAESEKGIIIEEFNALSPQAKQAVFHHNLGVLPVQEKLNLPYKVRGSSIVSIE
ncbi:hypothetical protein [Pseudoalteromonas arabiensis]|uniref:hypothetical protein n=1 Tax=Pseudoalteromonas arabiensis TaxID=874454 RepID=UPI000780ED0F|nr:hypothetical protein [Pseudoalteromonas arabiensis]|tara:strand:- start:1278 stop:2531 length:1254 start_codon:yes stop_codon:yes gene_type:complete